jgi:hypothetical protein
MTPREFKPCDELTPEDFQRHPIWGFDLQAAEEDDDADETWVRPYTFDQVPESTDDLFVAARLQGSDHAIFPGALVLNFDDSLPQVSGIVILQPTYLSLSVQGESIGEWDRPELAQLPALKPPVHYQATLSIAQATFEFSGKVW